MTEKHWKRWNKINKKHTHTHRQDIEIERRSEKRHTTNKTKRKLKLRNDKSRIIYTQKKQEGKCGFSFHKHEMSEIVSQRLYLKLVLYVISYFYCMDSVSGNGNENSAFTSRESRVVLKSQAHSMCMKS